VYFPRIPAVELELENDFFNGLLGASLRRARELPRSPEARA
jgi:hypothetical protein